MNALELAEWLDDLFDSDGEPKKAAAMLRRQHEELRAFRESERELMDVRDRQIEAIVKLRGALAKMKAHAIQIESKVGYLSDTRKQEVSQIYNLAAKALKDTEDLK